MSDVEELHSFTDTEDRFPSYLYLLHSIEKISVVQGYHSSRSIHRSPIECWVDIGSSREYKTITHIDIHIEMGRKNRDHYYNRTSEFYRSDIVESEIIEYPSRMFSVLHEDTYFDRHKKTRCISLVCMFFCVFCKRIIGSRRGVHRLRGSQPGSIRLR
jgi:hypothetical protein